MAVPVQVVGPGDAGSLSLEPTATAQRAEVSVFALTEQAGRLRRGQLVVRGTTGPKGEPCVVRLSRSAERLLVEAREADGGGPVMGSTVIAFDQERSAWKPQGGYLARSARGGRPFDVAEEKSGQETILVRIPERVRARIYVVATNYERLPNFAEVVVLAMNGKCVRRGSPRATGEGFDAERDQPLDPAYQRLLVVAHGWQNGRRLIGSVLLVFDHNNWRPATSYDQFEAAPDGRSGQWQPVVQYDAAAARFHPVLSGALWAPSQVRVLVPARPLGTWKPAGQSDGQLAPVASLCPPPAAALPGCQAAPENETADVLGELGVVKEPLASPAVEAIASRDAAIVEAGRPDAPGHPWADFGHRWVQGPLSMCWQAPLHRDQP
jgi:hypothetical protein